FGRGVGPPPRPGAEGLDESVLGAVLGRVEVRQDRGQGAEDFRIRGAVEAVEVFLRTGLVGVVRHRRNNGSGYSAGCRVKGTVKGVREGWFRRPGGGLVDGRRRGCGRVGWASRVLARGWAGEEG